MTSDIACLVKYTTPACMLHCDLPERSSLCVVPPALALYYACIARGPSLAWLCRIGLVLSFLAGITAVLLMWALYPVNYDYGQALKMSNFFYNAQRVGALPPDNSVPWRSNSLLYETGAQQQMICSTPSHPAMLPQPYSTSLTIWCAQSARCMPQQKSGSCGKAEDACAAGLSHRSARRSQQCGPDRGLAERRPCRQPEDDYAICVHRLSAVLEHAGLPRWLRPCQRHLGHHVDHQVSQLHDQPWDTSSHCAE